MKFRIQSLLWQSTKACACSYLHLFELQCVCVCIQYAWGRNQCVSLVFSECCVSPELRFLSVHGQHCNAIHEICASVSETDKMQKCLSKLYIIINISALNYAVTIINPIGCHSKTKNVKHQRYSNNYCVSMQIYSHC